MTEQEVSAIRLRALSPETRTDFSRFGYPDLAVPASSDMIVSAEREIGFSLWAEHRQILMELANGGFGPGDGLLGVRGGKLDDGGRSLIELRNLILSPEEAKRHIVPACDWGGGVWSVIDCQTGGILTCSELGIKDMGVSFRVWLLEWAAGKHWWQEMFHFDRIEVVDPKTGIRSRVSKIVRPE